MNIVRIKKSRKLHLVSVFFTSASLLLSASSIARAHLQPSIEEYVQFSRTVCIVKVTAISGDEISFSVEEVIKGGPPAILMLKPVFGDFPLNSEWLLAATGTNQNTVGWAIKGDYGWVNAPIQRVDGKIHLVAYHGLADPTLAADPAKGLTLEQLKELARKPLPKN